MEVHASDVRTVVRAGRLLNCSTTRPLHAGVAWGELVRIPMSPEKIMNTRIIKSRLLPLGFSAAFFLATSMSAEAAGALFEDDFSDGNFTADPAWSSQSGAWSVVGGALRSTGYWNEIRLPQGTFSVAEDGAFVLQFDVAFDSASVTGNNRFSIQLRGTDSQNVAFGYTIAVANGTWDNTGMTSTKSFSLLSRAATPPSFLANEPTPIRWERDAAGVVTLSVAGTVCWTYQTDPALVDYSSFWLFSRGNTAQVPDLLHSFDNFQVSSIPETASAGWVLGGMGLITACAWRRRDAGTGSSAKRSQVASE